MPISVALIVNPAAGGGRARRRAEAAERALSTLGTVQRWDTRGGGDERRCALEAADSGPRWIAIVGGDGTWGNAAGAIATAAGGRHPSNTGPSLLLLAGGTGNDFAKTLRTPAHDPAAMVALAAQGHERPIDVGCIGARPFLNCAGFGFDARVCEAMQAHRRLTGRAVYIVTAVSELFRYPGLRVGIDGGPQEDRLMLTCSNGQWFGGAFPIAPTAAPDDGVLDLTSIGAARPARRVALFARAFRGRHVTEPEVRMQRAASAVLRFDVPPFFEADGEPAQASSAEVVVSTLPNALRVVAPPAPLGR